MLDYAHEAKNKKQWLNNHKKLVVLIAATVALIAVTSYIISGKIIYAKQSLDQVSIVQIRQLIITAIDGLNKDAPVEAKTGDVYFPESRLYVPNPRSAIKLVYNWQPASDNTPEQLSVTLSQVPGTTQLYSSNNMTELFNTVPKVQACSRGVKVLKVEAPATNDIGELKKTFSLDDGSTVYLYSEDACPEMSQVVEVLTKLRTY